VLKISQHGKNNKPGLPNIGKPEFLSIGILRKAHGINGEMRMEVWTDFPERIVQGKEIFISENKEKFTIQSFRKINDGYLIRLEGIIDPETTQRIRNKIVYITSKDQPPLISGQFYYHDIIGLETFTIEKEYLGKIIEIIQTGSNDVYVVNDDNQEKPQILLPAIPSVIINVDLKNRKIIVNPPKWA
jgi:16S rRNA processing protein RimM